ncbi:MAG: hypothetical protein R3Y18_05345 [Bacillota bacterium]
MEKLVGMELSRAQEILQKSGREFEIVVYNDKKMDSHDTTLVLRASEVAGKVQLVATNFLFAPEVKENSDKSAQEE